MSLPLIKSDTQSWEQLLVCSVLGNRVLARPCARFASYNPVCSAAKVLHFTQFKHCSVALAQGEVSRFRNKRLEKNIETFFVRVCRVVICDCVFCSVVFNYSTPGERRRRNVYHVFCSTVLNVASQGLAVFSQLARNVTLCRPSF